MNRIIGLAILLIVSAWTWAQRYEITPIEGPERRSTYVADVNDSGQVVGWWRDAGGNDRAFIWESGVATDLGGFGGDDTRAVSINKAGAVVGNSEDVLGVNHAFVWTRLGGMKRLFAFRSHTWAMSINDEGDIVGYGYGRAFLFSGGVTTALPVRFPNGSSYVTDINDLGQIVGGDYQYQSEFPYPTIWIKGIPNGLPGGSSRIPLRINNKGQIVGYTSPAWSLGVPVTWINRQIFYLPMLAYGGEAKDVDDSGLIVGYLLDESYGCYAVVWRELQISHLNNDELAAEGWHLSSANAINERGQIVGGAKYGRTYLSYMLTPISR